MPSSKARKNVFRQLFDVRPVTERGSLDLDRILKMRPIVNFTHIIEDYERSFTPRRLKLFVGDQRGSELFKRYLQIRKPAVSALQPPGREIETGLVGAVRRQPEIIFEYPAQLASEAQILPSRDELLKQLERAVCGMEIKEEKLFPPAAAATSEAPAPIGKKSRFSGIGRAVPHFPISGLLVLAAFLILTLPLLNFIEKKTGESFGSQDRLKARENILKSRDLLAMVDFYSEAQTFEDLERNLIVSKQKINKISAALVGILENLPEDESGSVSSLVDLAKLFNQVSENFASAIDFYSGRNFFALLVPSGEERETITSLLEKSSRNFEEVLASLGKAQSEIQKVDPAALPADAADEILKLKGKAAELAELSGKFLESNRFLLGLLGGASSKKILMVIQDPASLRATGGLISGYVVAAADKGILGDFSVQDSYNLDLKLRDRIVPPRPLQRLDVSWGTGEANWFFDFPASARKLGWFFEKTGGAKIDYTVAMSAQVFEDLLKITGAINLPDSKKIVSAENFRDILAGLARPGDTSGYFSKIMAEFFPKFLQELANLELKTSFRVLDLINKNFAEKNILVYSADGSGNDYLEKMGWLGEIKNTKGNFLAVVDSVIGGNPVNSGSLKKTVKHHSEIQSDGRIINTLTVNYSHSLKTKARVGEGEEAKLDNFLRIFVPAGSELLEADIPEQEVYFPPIDYYAAGFRTDNEVAEMEYDLITDVSGIQIFREGGKTVFGFWVPVGLGGSRTVSIKYRLPLRVASDTDFYSFFIQKQPGDYSNFESVLVFPKNLKPTGRSTENLQVFNGLVKLSGELNKDKYYEVRFAP